MTTQGIVRWVIETFEGKLYTDDPVDTGGATKYGITLRTLQYYRRRINGDKRLIVTKVDVQQLTLDEAISCGTFVFATESKIQQIQSWETQLMVYDYYFHSGSRAIKALQLALGQPIQDGILGPLTLQQVNNYSDQLLLGIRVLTEREEFMQNLMEKQSTQRKYMFGWWRRTTKLQRFIII